jgi:hypothetical protein
LDFYNNTYTEAACASQGHDLSLLYEFIATTFVIPFSTFQSNVIQYRLGITAEEPNPLGQRGNANMPCTGLMALPTTGLRVSFTSSLAIRYVANSTYQSSALPNGNCLCALTCGLPVTLEATVFGAANQGFGNLVNALADMTIS